MVITPSGGLHIYFLLPNGINISGGVEKLGEGLDVQAGHKYAVLFGSIIASGKTKDGKIQSGGIYEIASTNAIAESPSWLIELIQSKTRSNNKLNEKISHSSNNDKTDTPLISNIDSKENINTSVQFLVKDAIPCIEKGSPGGEYLYPRRSLKFPPIESVKRDLCMACS